eukprot:superscaffoldBa00002483_g14425
MGLPTLEFSDSFLDSPEFRERLQCHEIELERTNRFIKDLIKDGNMLISALRSLSLAVQRFSQSLQEFQFECIGDAETDDEINIAQSLKEFSQLLSTMEEERKRLIQNADDVLISPLERFRKEQIGAVKINHGSQSSVSKRVMGTDAEREDRERVTDRERQLNSVRQYKHKEGKKQFDKETERYYSVLEKHLSLSSKKKESQLNEADSQMSKDRQIFYDASLQYVFKIQEVQERKKFEFVEPLLAFLQGLLTFYHEGYELASEFEPYKQQLQFNLQNARNNFESTRVEVERLMKRIRSAEEDFKAPGCFTMEGYLYIQEKQRCGERYSGNVQAALVCQKEDRFHRQTLLLRHRGGGEIYTLPSLLSKKEENESLSLYSPVASTAPSDMQLDGDAWDNKTITSGLKNYFRSLSSSITFFTEYDDQKYRVRAIHALVHKLPEKNRAMLDILTNHLLNDQNLMTVSNLGMIFGPTLMRSQEETVAAMMNIKFQNIVVEIIIENHHKIFGEAPDLSVPLPPAPSSRSTPRRNKAICLSSGKRKPRLYPPALCLADNDSDTFSSSPSTTPMGSQESLSSHSSEKNGLSPTSSPSSPAAEPSSSSTAQPSPPAASSCSPCSHTSSNGKDQKRPTDSAASPQLTPSSSWTSSQLATAQQTSSVSSSTSSLISAAERSLSVKGNSTASLSSVKESRSPSRASSSTISTQPSSVEGITSLREDYKSCHGSVQSLMSLDPQEATHLRKTSRMRCGSDLIPKHSAATSSNGYQRPGSMEAKALYSCEAEHSHELSFPQGALFSNVHPSVEPGWLQATYNGKTGLIPENYITYT